MWNRGRIRNWVKELLSVYLPHLKCLEGPVIVSAGTSLETLCRPACLIKPCSVTVSIYSFLDLQVDVSKRISYLSVQDMLSKKIQLCRRENRFIFLQTISHLVCLIVL